MQLSRCSAQDMRRARTLEAGNCENDRTRGYALSHGGYLSSGGESSQPTFKSMAFALPRKEVIQPHLPVRLPCYDFTPLTLHTFGASPLAVGPATSGADDSGGVTGGVYKARERIHRGVLIRDY